MTPGKQDPRAAAAGASSQHVDPDNRDAAAAFEQLSLHSAGLERALEAVRKKRDALDALIASHVSTQPSSPVWYAHPGVLTIDQAIAAVGGGPTGIHRAMERYRKANPPKPARKARR